MSSRKEQAEANYKAMMARGGQRAIRMAGGAEIFDRKGPEDERVSATGHKAGVTGVLDPRLELEHTQRATGNCYGAYFEKAHTGGSTEFLREFVDGGGVNGGGMNERQFQVVNMVIVAQAALSKKKALRYKRPKPRKKNGKQKKAKPGRFLPIPALTLINNVCVYGHSVESVAIQFQWFMIEYDVSNDGKVKTQWRPKQAIVEGIRTNLDVVGVAWADAGLNVPYQFGTIEVQG